MNTIYTNYNFVRFTLILLLLLSTLQVGCTSVERVRSSSENWIQLTTMVDGVLEVGVQVPKPSNDRWTTRTQFMGSKANEITRIFDLGYDPGRGKLSGAMMVYIYGSVVRIEKEEGDDRPINIGDLLNLVYLSNPAKKGDYQLAGKEVIGGDEWYRVNFIRQQPIDGTVYFRRIFENYGLLISMNMYGEGSDQSKLYQQRYQDLLKVLESVKVTVANFADE